jgi:hypothetical protein
MSRRIYNGTMFMWHLFVMKTMTQKFIPPLGLLSKRCISGTGKISKGLKKNCFQRYVQLVEINLSLSKSCIMWCRHLKGLSHVRDGRNQLKISAPFPFREIF